MCLIVFVWFQSNVNTPISCKIKKWYVIFMAIFSLQLTKYYGIEYRDFWFLQSCEAKFRRPLLSAWGRTPPIVYNQQFWNWNVSTRLTHEHNVFYWPFPSFWQLFFCYKNIVCHSDCSVKLILLLFVAI